MRSTPLAVRGFTLIELLVTIAIAAVLAAVAVPTVQAFLRNSELTAASSAMLTSINAARSEAMKSGHSAMLVPTNNDSDWSQGWVVFVDTNRDRSYTSGVDTVISQKGSVASYFSISGTGSANESPAYILFDPSGYAKKTDNTWTGTTLTIRRNDLSGITQLDQTRRIKIARTGRARVCQPASSTDNNCKQED